VNSDASWINLGVCQNQILFSVRDVKFRSLVKRNSEASAISSHLFSHLVGINMNSYNLNVTFVQSWLVISEQQDGLNSRRGCQRWSLIGSKVSNEYKICRWSMQAKGKGLHFMALLSSGSTSDRSIIVCTYEGRLESKFLWRVISWLNNLRLPSVSSTEAMSDSHKFRIDCEVQTF